MLDDLVGQADLGECCTVEPPSHQPLDIDHLVARAHVLQRVEVGRARILRGAAQLLEEAVLELARVPVGAALVGVEIAVLHQRGAHVVDAAPAVAAQDVLAETLLGDLLLRVQPPLRLELGPVDAAQLGHGHEERVERGINHIRVGLRARELGQAVVGGQLAGEELPGAIDGLAQHLAPGFHLHLLAQRGGLFLQALQRARARAGQPLHVAHATGAELFLCGLGRILAERLVGGELLLSHAGLLRAGKERHQAARLLGGLDRLIGGQHAVEHAAHVVGDRARGRVAREEILDAAVHVQQPGAEPAEQRLQLDARGVALGQVQLEGLGELLVIGALFLEVERAPLVQVAQAEPLHQRLHVAQHAALALGELVGVVGLHAGRHVDHRLKEEVAGFVQKRGQIRSA